MTRVVSEITASVWRVEVTDGASVAQGDVIAILESMKMEIPVRAPVAGICRLAIAETQIVQEDDLIATIE